MNTLKSSGGGYRVERHERHIVLFIGEQRWVLRDDAELQMMLQMFGLAESNEGTLLATFEAWRRGQSRTCSEPGNG